MNLLCLLYYRDTSQSHVFPFRLYINVILKLIGGVEKIKGSFYEFLFFFCFSFWVLYFSVICTRRRLTRVSTIANLSFSVRKWQTFLWTLPCFAKSFLSAFRQLVKVSTQVLDVRQKLNNGWKFLFLFFCLAFFFQSFFVFGTSLSIDIVPLDCCV